MLNIANPAIDLGGSSSLADFFESKIEALSSDDDICCIVHPDGQSGYGAVNATDKIVLSIKMRMVKIHIMQLIKDLF